MGLMNIDPNRMLQSNNKAGIIWYCVILSVMIYIGFQVKAQMEWFAVENIRMNQERNEALYRMNQ
jgi:hypothetical protein